MSESNASGSRSSLTGHEFFMKHALELAKNCSVLTSPNPKVGCVIVRDGQIIGEGFTQPAGQNHAEIEALADAARRGADCKGATVYVTLEPCAHYGKTPPCADALIRAGVSCVVAAMEDPNRLVAGKGLRKLEEAGIHVICGVLSQEAREMNPGFLSRIERGRPWVRMKVAASLDGKTALPNGESQWITSEKAREDGHRWRMRADAVMTGIGTVIKDNPTLNVRLPDVVRQPVRIVVDSQLKTPLDARVLEKHPDMVLIEFGINDAYLPYKTSVETCRINVEYMIDRIQESYPDCEIVLQVMNMPIREHLESRPNIEQYYDVYRKIARKRKLKLIDHYSYWTEVLEQGEEHFRTYVPDGLHPNKLAWETYTVPFILQELKIR